MNYPSSKCEECPLFDRLTNHHVPSRIVEGSKIIFVGEVPGEHEVSRQQPFIGKAGQYLDKQRAKAGIERYKVSDTNVLKCRPDKNRLPEGDLLRVAIDCCSETLKKDLQGTKVVVGLGNVPLLALTGLTGILKRRGSIYPLEDGRFFIGTIHPAAMIKASFIKSKSKDKAWFPPDSVIITDLRKAKRVLKDDFKLPVENFILYPGQMDFDSFLERMDDPDEIVALDIETPKDNRLELLSPIICALSFHDLTICASFEDDLEFLVDACKTKCKKVYQGGIFDLGVKKNCGIPVFNYFFDTLYAHHLLYAELKHDLGFIQSLYTDFPFHKDMKDEFSDAWGK